MKHQKQPTEFSVIIDAGPNMDKDAAYEFISDEFKKRYNHTFSVDLEPIKFKHFLCIKFTNSKDMNGVIDLNGIDYNGTPLLIAQYNMEKYKDLYKSIIEYLKQSYTDKMFDLTDIKSHLPSFNANYYVDLQLLFFFMGSFSRKLGLEVDILNLTNNRISNINVFKRLHNFLPNLKAVILDKNPIQDTTQLTEIMKGMIIRFNNLELGTLYNEDENGFPDVTNPKDIPKIDIPPPQPKRNRSENQSSQGDPEVATFLEKFFSAQSNDIGSTSDFYLHNSCFSFMFRNCSPQEPLAAFISYNQNLSYKKPEESVTQGSVNISSLQKEIFPNGFAGRIESQSINLVCGIFYSVNIVGNIPLEKDSDKMSKFYRQLTIYGVDGQLRIANDVLYLT